MKTTYPFEEICLSVLERAKSGPISLRELLHKTAGRGKYLILILLSLPFCFGVSIPGVSTPFGLLVAFIGFRIAFGKRIWIPHFLQHKKISAKALKKVFTKSLWLSQKIKFFFKPRLDFFKNRVVFVLHGMILVVLGLVLALPLPIPFTNLLAAWPIFLISLGHLQNDGLCILIGDLMVAFSVLFFFVVYKEILILASNGIPWHLFLSF